MPAYRQVGSYDMLRQAGGGQGVESTDEPDVMTHGSCDQSLEERTAQRLYGVPYDQLTPEQKHDVDETILSYGE